MRSVYPLIAATILLCGVAGAVEPFAIGGRMVQPGQRTDIDLEVRSGATDPATYIPVTVFHGTQAGPVLALTAGVHGYEYVPILAAQRLLERIDARRLRGTVILVRIAHVEAFEQRVPYVNPYDRKNLNRVFPGRADGTQSERIAWALTTEVIRRCDLHVELHAGDGAEWLEAFAGIYGGKLAAAQYARSREMGLAFGLRNLVKYSMDRQEQVDQGRSCNRQAVADGKPTVLIEIGENGRTDESLVRTLADGVENLLRVLRMTEGSPKPVRKDVRWLDNTTGVSAGHTGVWTPAIRTGRAVRKGELLGTIRDYSGRVVETVTSPVDGYLLYGLAGPPVKQGESVVTIGLPADPGFLD
jgi:predicted deacylase